MFLEQYLKKTPIFDLFRVFILTKRQTLISVTQHYSKPKSYRKNGVKNLKAGGSAAKDVRRSSRRNIGAKASTVNMYFPFESVPPKFFCRHFFIISSIKCLITEFVYGNFLVCQNFGRNQKTPLLALFLNLNIY